MSISPAAPPRIRRLTVYDTPTAKARPRVTVQNGKARGYTPAKTKEAEWRIRNAWIAEHGTEPMVGPLELAVALFLPIPASMPKKYRETAPHIKRPDLDNCVKLLLDGLLGVAFADDSQVVHIDATKQYARDGAPRWEIALESLA